MADKPHLSPREKRAWTKKVADAQEAVEEAVIARNRLMGEAFAAGVSYNALEVSTGLGPQSVRNSVDDPERASEGRSAHS